MPSRLFPAFVTSAVAVCLVMLQTAVQHLHQHPKPTTMGWHSDYHTFNLHESLSHTLNSTLTVPLGEATLPCGGCLLALTSPAGPTCGKLIYDKIKETKHFNITLKLTDAATAVATKYPQACHRCHRDACTSRDDQRHYWRFDERAPSVTYARTHFLDIPSHFRVPYLTNDNITKYFDDGANRIPNRTFLFEYNPTLAHLPKDQIPANLDQNQWYYLGIIRLASVHDCFTEEQRWLQDPEHKIYPGKELLGFVILDTQLNILQQSILYHVNFIDHRLFNLNGQLFLGYMHHLSRLWLNPPQDSFGVDTGKIHKLSNGAGMPRRDFPVYIEKQRLCGWSPLCRGKNFNYFVDDNNTIMVETKPMGSHVVEPVPLDKPCPTQKRQDILSIEEEIALTRLYQEGRNHLNDTTVFLSSDIPAESFVTEDEVYFPAHGIYRIPLSPERGTACCVRIPDPRQHQHDNNHTDYLLMGVSHVKFPHWKHYMQQRNATGVDYAVRGYLSRLYAFEPVPPYRLVARSGKFCLGLPASAREAMENPNNRYLERRLQHFNHTQLACPLIHFVTSIVEAVDDNQQVIISYGLNDCVARMAKVQKSELVQLLFPQSVPLH